MYVLKGRRNGGDLIALSADGRALAARSESGLQLWRGLPTATLAVRPALAAGHMAFAPDGRLLVDGATPGWYDPVPDALAPFPPAPARYRFLALSPDGRFVLATLMPGRGGGEWCKVQRWPADRVSAGEPAWEVEVPRGSAGRPSVLPDGRFVIEEYIRAPRTRDRAFVLVVRSAEAGAVLAESPPSAWDPDRGLLPATADWVAGLRDNRIKVWALADLARPPVELTTGSRKMFTRVAFHPSGAYLAATSTDGTVKFFETATWALARTYEWGVGKVQSVAFSGDGCLVAAGGEAGRIVVWDVDV